MRNIFVISIFLFGIIFSSELFSNLKDSNISNRDECEDIDNPEECYDNGCEWNEEEGCYWSDDDCSNFGYEDCMYFDFCEWTMDSDDPAGNGYCVDPNNDNGPPECVLDCEGIEDVSPDDDFYHFCEWLVEASTTECIEDCDDEVTQEIIEYLVLCEECLSGGICDEEGHDCDPDLACATVITCYEGLLYPTSCGPENCDEPIGECDDYYEGCQSDSGQWYDIGQEMFINYCEYYECTLNGWEGTFSLDNDDCSDDGGDLECSDLTQDECMLSDQCEWSSYITPNGFYEGCVDADDGGDLECNDLTQDECEWYDGCQWIPDSDNPNSWGYCVETDDNDGPPDCLDDCEGIQDIDPSENPYEACDWIISFLGFDPGFGSCTQDCDEEILMEINEIVEACYECLENQDFDCADVFDDDQDEECSELNYPDCMDAEGCEWVIINEWGGYSCVEIDENNNCYDLNNEECIDDPNCEPNYNAAGQFEGCEEVNYQDNFGLLYGSVDYVYGDYVDFVPYAPVFIESYPSNSDMYYFQTMTDGEGYYQIALPPDSYMVTAYANEDSLTLDIVITPNSDNELNFLMGEWGGNGGPDAVLSLDAAQGVPGDMVSIPLYLSSNESVAGIQFTLESGTPNVQDVLIPSGIESIDPCFSAQFNNLDNQFLAIIFSMEGCSYPPEEMLHIADLVYSISDDAPFGMEVPLYFSDTIVSDTSGNEIYSFGVDSFVLIGMQGDVNGDGELNVLDIVMIVNFALYLDEPTEQQFWASDINGDNLINILDIVQVVNMILDR